MKPLELWGGVECTVNRVGDRYCDQLRETGHDGRDGDIELIAGLGLSAIRYPVLWERVCHRGPGTFDWDWSDRRLERLRELGIRPIVGLVHHGSGPPHTSLIDPRFATGLAEFAAAVAERYPWIDEWTPVNEPLTTARFSALYGLWYPHLRDERMFCLALLNQVVAVRRAMVAIRTVVPTARLLQTEDLGRTYATRPLADQAAFDNSRRWMTWDMLFGQVVPGHAQWNRLCSFGLEQRLRQIADDPCPPDTIGINHYLTSDRFLDHRVAAYPPERRGSNGRQAYADLEAVRVLDPPPQGLAGAIHETWQRYHTPIALSEVHNGCSREDQLRWLRDAWHDAEAARAAGAEVRAVTCWALFGSSGWDTLLTRPGRYERGAFDAAGNEPRPTAIARSLAAGTPGHHPAGEGSGWWRRELRFAHARRPRPAPRSEQTQQAASLACKPVLIAGASGTLGQAMARECAHRGIAHVVTGRADLDLLDPLSIEQGLDRLEPWAVINCAGWVRVDEAEANPAECLGVNANGASALATACAARDIATVSFSSDLVFGGAKDGAYVERDTTDALNVYGASKAMMEQHIFALPGTHLVVRTAAFFSPHDEANFAVHLVQSLRRGETFTAADDYAVSPTYVPDLCHAVLDLMIDGERGVWHLTNGEPVTWWQFAGRIADVCGLDRRLIAALPAAEMGWAARRPKASALASERGSLMPPLQSALDRFRDIYQATAGH